MLQLLQFVDWLASVAVGLVAQGSTVWVFDYGGGSFGVWSRWPHDIGGRGGRVFVSLARSRVRCLQMWEM